jgi:hypothetical protein
MVHPEELEEWKIKSNLPMWSPLLSSHLYFKGQIFLSCHNNKISYQFGNYLSFKIQFQYCMFPLKLFFLMTKDKNMCQYPLVTDKINNGSYPINSHASFLSKLLISYLPYYTYLFYFFISLVSCQLPV